MAEDLTIVRGNHQFGIGGKLQLLEGRLHLHVALERELDLQRFGDRLAMADLLVGRVTSVEHGGPNKVLVNNWHMGLYAQDSWRASSRVTVNVGARWEPYFGQNVVNNAIAIFKMENFQQGIKSTGVPQRAGRPDLSGGRRLSAGTDGVGRPVVEHLAPPRRGVGCPRRWPPRGALLVLHGL